MRRKFVVATTRTRRSARGRRRYERASLLNGETRRSVIILKTWKGEIRCSNTMAILTAESAGAGAEARGVS